MGWHDVVHAGHFHEGRGEIMGKPVPNNSQQLTLTFEPGLAERHLSLRDCMTAQVYQRGHGQVALLLDMAPSKLTEKLAGVDSAGRARGMTLDQFERYLDKTGDTTPILYLVAKYLRDPHVAQTEAIVKLAQLADILPGLLERAGFGARS